MRRAGDTGLPCTEWADWRRGEPAGMRTGEMRPELASNGFADRIGLPLRLEARLELRLGLRPARPNGLGLGNGSVRSGDCLIGDVAAGAGAFGALGSGRLDPSLLSMV